MRYVALLRGINVGGKAVVRMAVLAKALEELAFTNVKTFLNSGNVLFDTPKMDEKKLVEKIEVQLEKKFDRKIRIVLRTQEYIQKMKNESPYSSYDQMDKTLYFLVVFFSDNLTDSLSVPQVGKTTGLTVTDISDREICLILDRKLLAQTGDVMKFIGKEFPGLSTSRTWNTVTKLAVL